MKRYLLFAAQTYYPSGGWGDFISDYDSIEEARVQGNIREEQFNEWYEIIDTQTKKAIEE